MITMILIPTFFPWVSRIGKAGSTPLNGIITLSPGTNVAINQVGQDIEIVAAGGGGGNVTGPGGGSVDTGVAVWDGTAGTLLKSTAATINSGSGVLLVAAGITLQGIITLGTTNGVTLNWEAGVNVNPPANPALITDWIQIQTAAGARFIPLYT